MYKREERLWPGGCGLFPSRFFMRKSFLGYFAR